MSVDPASISVEALETDPYPIYARLRAEAPAAYIPAVNTWFVTRWDDVNFVTKTPDLFSAKDLSNPICLHFGTPVILQSDGDEHAVLRNGIAPHYAPGKVASYIDALVRPIAEEHFQKFRADGRAELMEDYFEPISVLSLARSFGLHEVGVPTLRRWFAGLAQGAINFERDPARTAICAEAVADIGRELEPLFDRLETRDDGSALANMMRHGMPDGAVRPRDFIMPSVLVALLGGMQEPGHGAGTTLYALLNDPAQMHLVRNDMTRNLSLAVQEGVRWVSPIGTQVRTPLADLELAGVTIPKGAAVSAILASANRDDRVFDRPDSFDLRRFDAKPGTAAFGFGPHFCAGKWFALAQMEISLRVLLENTRNLRLADGHPVAFQGWEFRAPTSLHVAFDASR